MNPIVLYDGVCGLCNRLVQFILRRDHGERFRFAALQSNFARIILERHGLNPDALDTFHVVFDHGAPAERVLARDEGIVVVLEELGGMWRFYAKLFRLLPRSLRRWQYNLIAGNRYRIFGKYDVCPLPEPKIRHRFLDQRD